MFTPDTKLHVQVHFLPGHLYHQEGLEDQAVQEVQYYPGDPVKISQGCKLSQSCLELTTKGHTLKQIGQNLIPRTDLAWWKRIIWCKLGWSKIWHFKQNLTMNLLQTIPTEMTYRVFYPPVPQRLVLLKILLKILHSQICTFLCNSRLFQPRPPQLCFWLILCKYCRSSGKRWHS